MIRSVKVKECGRIKLQREKSLSRLTGSLFSSLGHLLNLGLGWRYTVCRRQRLSWRKENPVEFLTAIVGQHQRLESKGAPNARLIFPPGSAKCCSGKGSREWLGKWVKSHTVFLCLNQSSVYCSFGWLAIFGYHSVTMNLWLHVFWWAHLCWGRSQVWNCWDIGICI